MHDRNFLHKLFGAVHLTGSVHENTDPQLANQNAPFCGRTRAPYNKSDYSIWQGITRANVYPSCLGVNKAFSLLYLWPMLSPVYISLYCTHEHISYQTVFQFGIFFQFQFPYHIQYIFMLASLRKDYPLGTWLVSDLRTMHISCTMAKFHDLWARSLDSIVGFTKMIEIGSLCSLSSG